jgi:signal peptidase I
MTGDRKVASEERPAAERGDEGVLSAGEGEDDGVGDTGSRAGGGKEPKQQRSFWKELPLLIGIALVLALLIKTFLLQAFFIPSGSMENTLKIGDRVLVDKLTPWFGAEPQRGEVVVFHDPGGWLPEAPVQQNAFQEALSFIGLMPSADEEDLIKRVIAVGGDTVACKRGGKVKVNGHTLEEPYLYPGNTPCDDRPFGPVTVPEGYMWVMGDHRQNSADSRYHMNLHNGMVPVDDAVGRAVVVAWPLDRWSTLPVPDTFQQKGLAAKALDSTPAALGLVGALPLVVWRRRRRGSRGAIKG